MYYLTFESFVNSLNLKDKSELTKDKLYNCKVVCNTDTNLNTTPDVRQYLKNIEYKNDNRTKNKNKYVNILYNLLVTNREKFLYEIYNRRLKIKNKNKYLHFWDDNTNILKKDRILGYKKNKGKFIRNINYNKISNTKKLYKNDVLCFLPIFSNMFNLKYIRNVLLLPSMYKFILDRNYERLISSLWGTINIASVFNPYTCKFIFDNILTGEKLFTPVLGWNSYQLGFHNSRQKHYVGTDVIPEVINAGKLLNNEFNKKTNLSKFFSNKNENKKRVDLYCCPSEKLNERYNFSDKYYEYFDNIFFSPPYYDLELYDSEEQSINSYPNYEDWLSKYWEETIKLCYSVLKKNGKLGFVISNYSNYVEKKDYNISEDLKQITEKHFKYIKRYRIQWGAFNNAKKMRGGNFENFFIFQK